MTYKCPDCGHGINFNHQGCNMTQTDTPNQKAALDADINTIREAIECSITLRNTFGGNVGGGNDIFKEAKLACEKIRTALQATQVPQWMPIETAPKDGTRILVKYKWGEGGKEYTVEAWWDNKCWNAHLNRMIRAYIWQPLPQPPREEVK